MSAGLDPGHLIEMLRLMSFEGGLAQDRALICKYIEAGCSATAIKLMIDLQENKCDDKELQSYFNDNLKIKDDL